MKFTDLLKGTNAYLKGKASEAVKWYSNLMKNFGKKITTSGPQDAMQGLTKAGLPKTGRMYIYYYDPFHRQTLPYWDQYPLIIFLENKHLKHGTGFSGLNLHYLPPMARAVLLEQLIALTNNKNFDDTTYIDVWQTDIRKFSGFNNCIKLYLYSQVRSSFHEVHPSQWDKIILLPLQRWVVNPNPQKAGKPPY